MLQSVLHARATCVTNTGNESPHENGVIVKKELERPVANAHFGKRTLGK